VLAGNDCHLSRLDGLHPDAHAVLVGIALHRPQDEAADGVAPPIGEHTLTASAATS
jgi:hypothetical protein